MTLRPMRRAASSSALVTAAVHIARDTSSSKMGPASMHLCAHQSSLCNQGVSTSASKRRPMEHQLRAGAAHFSDWRWEPAQPTAAPQELEMQAEPGYLAGAGAPTDGAEEDEEIARHLDEVDAKLEEELAAAMSELYGLLQASGSADDAGSMMSSLPSDMQSRMHQLMPRLRTTMRHTQLAA
mmetsp:Transcript_6133/g.13627  ORF Transcript_6133/g.13627 Transcript_6133/m.13627 type:complete len:182 (+) Transcript_6133:77-622(+)